MQDIMYNPILRKLLGILEELTTILGLELM
jgi:hypothetical protein